MLTKQNIKNHLEYTPYGEIWIEDQKQEDLDKTPYRFTGKILDEETDLLYMSARYQNPMTSRWISADPKGPQLVNPMDRKGNLRSDYSIIDAVNWYSYCSNNPVRYLDPTGNQSFDYENWYNGALYGTLRGLEAFARNSVGEKLNFLSNLFTGKVSPSFSANCSIGKGAVGGQLELSKDGFSFTSSSSLHPDNIQGLVTDLMGANVNITTDEFEVSYSIASVGVEKNDDGTATLSIGVDGDLSKVIKLLPDDVASVGVEVGMTASTQDGPAGTIMNRKSESLDQAVQDFNYYTSSDWAMENFK